MKLKKIHLKNFRAYRDQTIEFSVSENKNVTLLYGENGQGKTSLFEAINWVLYDEKQIVGKGKIIKRMKEIISRHLVRELVMDGERAELLVEIEFIHEKTVYHLRKTASFEKKNEEMIYIKDSTNAKLEKIAPHTSKPEIYTDMETINKIINSMMPASSREYFLFDGERIDNFAKREEGEVEKAIREVLGLDYIKFAMHHLSSCSDEWREKWKHNEEHNEDFVNQNKALENKLKEKDVKTKEIIEFQDKFDGLSEELKEKKAEYESLEQEREKIAEKFKLEEEANKKELETNGNKIFLRSSLTKSYPIYANKILKEAYDLLLRWKNEGRFPVRYYTDTFIKDILKTKKCFFWTFEEGSKEQKFFEKKLEEMKAWGEVTLQTELMNLFARINLRMEYNETEFGKLKQEFGKYNSNCAELKKIRTDLDKVNSLITSNVTHDKVKQIDSEYETLKIKFSHAKRDLEESQTDLTAINKRIDQIQDILVKHVATDKQSQIYKARFELAISAKKRFEELLNDYAKKKKVEVEAKMKVIFKNLLLTKPKVYKDPFLDDSYQLQLPDIFGPSGEDVLSKGEGQLLILSFIAALVKTANEQAPMIMDTPLHRLSVRNTTAVCKNLPNQVSQLILFVTDKELSIEGEKALIERCDKIWTIKFNDENFVVNVLPGKQVSSEYGYKEEERVVVKK